MWDTKQIHAPVLQTDSQRHGYQKKPEKTRGVFGFHWTGLWLVNASPCLQSSAVSIVSPLLSHRLTSTCTQPLAFTCWWSPLLCTWLKTLACWHGARFSGETGGGSVAAFSLQPAATWWCTGTNSSEAACALQTSPPSATRLISYITKVGGKWKKKTLWGWKWFGGLFRTHFSPYLSFSLAVAVQWLYLFDSIQRNLPVSLSVDVCATLTVTCLIVFGLVTLEHESFHRFYPHFHLYQPQLLLRRSWPLR